MGPVMKGMGSITKKDNFCKIRMNCDEMSPFWESNFLGGGSARIPKSLVMKSRVLKRSSWTQESYLGGCFDHCVWGWGGA